MYIGTIFNYYFNLIYKFYLISFKSITVNRRSTITILFEIN